MTDNVMERARKVWNEIVEEAGADAPVAKAHLTPIAAALLRERIDELEICGSCVCWMLRDTKCHHCMRLAGLRRQLGKVEHG